MMENGEMRRYSRRRERCDIQWVYYIYDVIVENRKVVQESAAGRRREKIYKNMF